MGKLKHVDAFNRLKEISRFKISKRGAAKMLVKEGFFTSVEKARAFVRQHTMALGDSSRDNIPWIEDVPTPIETEFGVLEIPKDTDGIGLLCDIHIPFQDEKTIRSFLERKDEYKTIIIQEVFDFFSLSRFHKHRTLDIAKEQEDFFQLMELIRKEAPEHRIIFQQGNHDDRFWVYVMRQARELENLIGMEFETIFGFDEFGIELLPTRNLIHYRELYIGHGHEINAGGVPVSPARTFSLKTKGNFIGGHFHRTSEHITRNIKGDVMGCWSVGCACNLQPLYAPVNEWNNGYAIIRPYGEDQFRVKNIKLF